MPCEINVVIPGYVPPTRNAIRGMHWSVESREKKRAMLALHEALVEGLASGLLSTLSNPQIGMDTQLNKFKTALFKSASCLRTIGKFSNATASGLKRHTRKRKNARK